MWKRSNAGIENSRMLHVGASQILFIDRGSIPGYTYGRGLVVGEVSQPSFVAGGLGLENERVSGLYRASRPK